MRRTRRADCQAVLLKAASILERHFNVNHRYDNPGTAGTLPTSVPTTCPVDGGVATYTIAATFAPPPASGGAVGSVFQLTATRAGTQATDRCGDFTLDQVGRKGLENTTLTVAECWR
ncbi:MAG: type IV pilin protein [Azoarcus sp.]|nr:type IV pilin protein [Azoarcus sp.]